MRYQTAPRPVLNAKGSLRQTIEVLDVAVNLIRDSRPKIPNVRLIAIDGPSGSGKTDFAAALANKLQASVIHLDEIYRGWDGLAETIGLIVEFIGEPLANRKPIKIPTWDWHNSAPGPLKEIPTKTHIIIEGVGSGSLPVARFLTTLIWLDAPEKIRKERALARDGETFAQHWDAWAASEQALWESDDPKVRADLNFDTAEFTLS